VNRRRTWIALLVLAAAMTALFVARRLRGEGGGDGEPAAATEVAVHTVRIEKATLHRYVTAYGRVTPEPSTAGRPPAGMVIGSPVAGLLVGIDCVEGRRAAKGDTLFRLDSRVAEVEVDRARRALDFAEQTLERQRKLLPVEGTSRRELLEAEAARDAAKNSLAAAETNLALLRIEAPLSGTVVRIEARLGQSVDSGTKLAEIVDLGRLVISAQVPSSEAAMVETGQEVLLGNGGAPAAKVSYIASEIDPATDTVSVRAALPAGSGYLPGSFLEARILVDEHPGSLVVPEESLVTRAGEGEWIVVVQGDEAVRKPVTSGLREGGLVEVTGDGLAEGAEIVGAEAYSLPPETRVRKLNS